MSDLLLFFPNKKSYMAKLEYLLKSLLKGYKTGLYEKYKYHDCRIQLAVALVDVDAPPFLQLFIFSTNKYNTNWVQVDRSEGVAPY